MGPLVDAQLPVRLVPLLSELGHDVVHTWELPKGNRTPDRKITRIAEVQDRIVVTKDRDYVDGHLLSGAPRRLLLVSTGNIRNDDLIDLFAGYPDVLADAFYDVDFVGLDRNVLARTPPCGP